jgi:hypothetical protein
VKDVIGPKGCASIVAKDAAAAGQSSNVDAHSKTQSILLHHSETNSEGKLSKADEWISTGDEPDHDGLCLREQSFFLDAIRRDVDLGDHMDDAVQSMRIVAAADESFRTGRTIDL